MINEEAIEYLKQLIETGYDSTHNGERLRAAISALESIDRIKAKHNARDKLVDELEDRVFSLTAERDAAIADIKEAARFPCKFCKKEENGCDCYCAYDKWEWRGIQDAD